MAASSGFVIAMSLVSAACSGGDEPIEPATAGGGHGGPTDASPALSGEERIDGVFEVASGRSLYLRCTGEGSPTLVLEGGDGDTSDSYAFAESTLAAETRTCVYDRANLGMSDPAAGPRGFDELVGDLENLLEEAGVDPPYVLVGTSGGGFITAGYAVRNPSDVAGMVFIDTGSPFRNPPRPIVEETTWNHPSNVEQRDYLQVERDAWAAREQVGDIPVSVVTVEYAPADIDASPFPSEQAMMRDNVQAQQGWLVLSPSAEQIVVQTGHAVEEDDPRLVIDVILDVLEAARAQG
jgi:pimeloyl-ACP methyl ester carboxylesterase